MNKVEIFFNVNGKVNYFSPDKSIWNEYHFEDAARSIRVFPAAITLQQSEVSGPSEEYFFDEGDYEQVKFLFQHYLPRNGMNINATEVWEDRERILRQTKEFLELAKMESDLNLREKRLKLNDAEEQISAYEDHKKTQKPTNLLEFPGGGKFKN